MQSDIDQLDVNLSQDVQDAITSVIHTRREIHRHPELGFKEKKTQQLICDHLLESGIEPVRVAQTGVTALIQGEQPGPVLLIRADIDALPITEMCDVPWKSENEGVMHACGHDAHTSIVLTAARILKKRGLKRGAVKLMFQPAEEGDGGALAMIEAGILENPKVDAALGFHVWTGYPTGEIVTKEGPVAASVDGFKLVVHGKGTHAATPEQGIDPITVAASIITSSQAILTRRIKASDPAVLSFTAINGGTAFNIIPEAVEILGTFRTFNNEVRENLRTDLIRLAQDIANPFGATITYETISEAIPVITDSKMTQMARESAIQVVGKKRLISPSPLLVGEDFGEILARVPGTFVVLGCGNQALNTQYPHHHPRFSIDERAMPIGVQIAVNFASQFTKNHVVSKS